jgi:predicted Fe-Mo cluster-binding NifX family protein
MIKTIAIPVSKGILDEHFGHCDQFELFQITDNKITQQSTTDAPPHEPGLLPEWLGNKGVTDIIAGGMGNRAIQLFQKAGVNVFVGAPKLSAQNLIEGFINQTIQFTANYCDH